MHRPATAEHLIQHGAKVGVELVSAPATPDDPANQPPAPSPEPEPDAAPPVDQAEKPKKTSSRSK